MAARKKVAAKMVTNEDIKIGARIRAFRHAKEMPQVELAEALGFSFQQLQKVELGRNRISGGRVVAICKALDVTPNQLFAWKG